LVFFIYVSWGLCNVFGVAVALGMGATALEPQAASAQAETTEMLRAARAPRTPQMSGQRERERDSIDDSIDHLSMWYAPDNRQRATIAMSSTMSSGTGRLRIERYGRRRRSAHTATHFRDKQAQRRTKESSTLQRLAFLTRHARALYSCLIAPVKIVPFPGVDQRIVAAKGQKAVLRGSRHRRGDTTQYDAMA
jgi:hypothetical protein